jgi:hypothetical protein
MRYAWIENGQILNVIVWDGETDLNLPEHVTLIDSEEAGPGWRWNNEDGFIAPEPPPE